MTIDGSKLQVLIPNIYGSFLCLNIVFYLMFGPLAVPRLTHLSDNPSKGDLNAAYQCPWIVLLNCSSSRQKVQKTRFVEFCTYIPRVLSYTTCGAIHACTCGMSPFQLTTQQTSFEIEIEWKVWMNEWDLLMDDWYSLSIHLHLD